MAKLGAYYGLCPIIDQKSLLGINNDSQTGQVLVTLGKNIAIKYKLSDQKQLVSWRTKAKFTSPIIYYAKTQKYCAVFNKTYLMFWDDETEQLDKLKKLKFTKPIHSLCTWSNTAFLIFDNGAIIPLEKGLDTYKTLQPPDTFKNSANHRIIQVFLVENAGQLYGGLLIGSQSAGKEFIVMMVENCEVIARITLHKENASISGCLLTTLHGNKVVLLTLWSDGKLFSYNLHEHLESFVTIVDCISCESDVTLCALSADYIVMYGADNSQEGAVLSIFNVQFKIMQCKQLFKMYASGTKIWCLESNVFLCVGQHLAVVPYRLHSEQLAALVGSHRSKTIDPDISIVQELNVLRWSSKTNETKQRHETPPNARIFELCKQGWSESLIIEEVLPKYMEENDLHAIKQCLDYFEDIPEESRVQLLNYILEASSNCFKKKKRELSMKIPECLTPFARCRYIDRILLKSFNDVALLPQLRVHLSLKNTLLLLRYICYLLSEDGHIIHDDIATGDRKLIDWGCVLLDANYQKLLLTKDQHIVETLMYFNELVNAHICSLDAFQGLAPIVSSLCSKTYQRSRFARAKYLIEHIHLYKQQGNT